MSHLPDSIDERHVRWIYDAIRLIAEGKLAAGVLGDFEVKVGPGLDAESEVTGAKAARILSWIALEAIDALEGLPCESQAAAAAESKAWPVAVRPKVVTSVKQIESNLKKLRFAEGLQIDVNHSARSADGKNVPLEESSEPGIGLARRLHEEILAFKSSFGFADGGPLDSAAIANLDPGAIGDRIFDEKATKQERDGARIQIITASVTLHFFYLLGQVGDLSKASVGLWTLTALRWMQYRNDGALVHEVLSGESKGERLSGYIPAPFWSAVKGEAVSAAKNPARLLERNIQRALKNGFQALAKS